MNNTIDFNKAKEEKDNALSDKLKEIMDCLKAAEEMDGQAIVIFNNLEGRSFWWKFNMIDDEVNLELDKLKLKIVLDNINTLED